MKRKLGFFFVLTLFVGCATLQPNPPYSEEGIASWYGTAFSGKTTASGESYFPHQFTAAHPTLPFNTKVKVTNLDNGKFVIVRINDRGPFAKDRIIDLSYAAAKQIQMVGKGIARVHIEVVRE